MFSSLDGSLFIMPLCYHPTTVLSIDDDEAFLKILSLQVAKTLPLLCFNKPEEALTYTKQKHAYFPFTSRCLTETNEGITFNFLAIRQEVYNNDRFKEINISVTDYDMPHISGIELIKTMAFQPAISQYSHIILTGKISDEFKEKIAGLGMNGEYIGKDDPDYVNKLLALVKQRSAKIFQWYAYMPARILSRNTDECSPFLFDGNVATLLNRHLQENNICELYLFDKQGSYLFLDDQANLSWLFIRNETGIKNSIARAKHYGAPKQIIDALQSKKYILSLYEPSDFEAKTHIDWESYLLPATVFKSNDKYLHALPNLPPPSDYYFAFTTSFPENGIDQTKILSYRTYLSELA